MNKAVFWDFDGTLVRANESFLQSLDGALRLSGHPFERSKLKSFLLSSCPWYSPEKDYSCQKGERWWPAFFEKVRSFCTENGVDASLHDSICAEFRRSVVSFDYSVYEDAEPVLSACLAKEYKNYLLSNNYPELVSVTERFGLSRYFSDFFVSAIIGYEKPRPELFRHALNIAGNPGCCFMVGDNPVADIQGAQAAGMTAILVHHGSDGASPDYCFDALTNILDII